MVTAKQTLVWIDLGGAAAGPDLFRERILEFEGLGVSAALH